MFRLRFLPLLFLLPLSVAPLRAQFDRKVYTVSPDISVRQIARGVWLHTWWMQTEDWGRISSNGLIVVADNEALLVDTPMNDTMTAQLLRWVENKLKVPVRRAVLTHAHNDRMGGIGELKRRGIVSYTLAATAERGVAQKWPRPDSVFAEEQRIPVGRRTLLAWFPGPGHAPDNIVVWLDRERILYGGCLVKAQDAESIGYIGDASVDRWPATIQRVQRRFRGATVVIPGHGVVGGTRALRRTLELLEGLEQK